MKKLNDQERVDAFKAMIQNFLDSGARTESHPDHAFYLALLTTVDEIEKREPARIQVAEEQLGRAITALERSRRQSMYGENQVTDVAMKTRAYWPMIREALRKYAFRCSALHSSVGANLPQECNWPMCSCDPYADKVIAALQECGVLKEEAS